MAKLFKNIHWFIIALALYNIGSYYLEITEKTESTRAQVEQQRLALSRVKRTKKEIASFYKNIQEAKNKIERVAQEIEKTQQILPSEVTDTDIITILRKMAEDVNIKEMSIMPEGDDDRGFYIARRYKFKAKATYLQFLIMFEKISENKRILNVGELTFKKLEQPQRSKFQLIDGEFTLEAYKYNVNFKEDRGLDKIESEFKDNKVGEDKGARAETKNPATKKEEEI